MANHYANLIQRYTQAAGHLAARSLGAEHYVHKYSAITRRDVVVVDHMDQEELQKNIQAILERIPPWGVLLMLGTLITAIVTIISVRYTLHGVVGTLAMVESPQTTVLVRQDKEKYTDDADALAEGIIDEEIIILKQKPITASIRSTIHHLQARAGLLSRWRGLSALMAFGITNALLKSCMFELFGDLVDSSIAAVVASVLSRVLLARLGMTWTHIVISEPSTKSWIRRIPNFNAWKKVLVPTFYTACAWQLTLTLPKYLAAALDLDNADALTEENVQFIAMKLLWIGAITFTAFVGICIPAEVSLRRVQASMLPEEDKSIVSFDRSFGGLVVPEALGGKGVIGYAAAWSTFDRSARLRLLKMYAKFFFVEVALHVFFVVALVMQFVAFAGEDQEAFKIQPVSN